MDNRDLEIMRLKGEVQLLEEELARLRPKEGADDLLPGQLDWWAEEMMFWRTKWLLEHPERQNLEYVQNARLDERIDVMLFV